MNFQNKRVFISGGSGVIGRVLVEKLHALGATILVGDLKPRPAGWPASILYRQGDLNYIRAEELEQFAPEYFFHLAATFERSTETYGFWQENYQHNVQLSNYLMGLLKDSATLKKVIFASSYLIYDKQLYCFDRPATAPRSLSETDPVSPRNLTGSAKLNHEIELKFLDEFRGNQFKTVSARIYRSYGRNSRDVISRWIRSLMKGESLTLFRKEGLFDYIFADDVAHGLLLLAASENAAGVYNLGTGNARRVEEVIQALQQHFPNLHYTEADSDIPYEASQADVSKLYRETGWKPGTTLEAAIAQIVDFERQREGREEDESLPAFAVLVTSIARKVPLLEGVKQAAAKLGGQIRVIGGDVNEQALGQYFADDFFVMPRLNNWPVQEIIAYCHQHQVRLIIPTRDGELLFWAQQKAALAEAGIAVMVSDEHGIRHCLDKLQFYTALQAAGIPAIPTATDIDSLSAGSYVVKERFGAGSISIGINLEKEAAVQHAQKLEQPVFQPYIKGKEYSVDLYVSRKQKIIGGICRTRDVVISGESQVTTTCVHEKALAVCEQIAGLLQLTGHLVFQLLEDEKGGLHIIECNGRFGGASALAVKAGLDSFYWALLETTGVEELYFTAATRPIKQVRYAADKYITG